MSNNLRGFDGPAYSKSFPDYPGGKGKGKGKGKIPWQFDHAGNRIDLITTSIGEQFVPLFKDKQLSLHPDVQARSYQDNELLRTKESIEVFSLDREREVRKEPLWTKLEECQFPQSYIDALFHIKWKAPTPIQMQAWPAGLTGSNILAVSPTGSGKTMAYLLPLLAKLETYPSVYGEGPSSIIFVPTKELVRQVSKLVRDFFFLANLPLNCRAVCRDEADDNLLHDKIDIVVATPGKWWSLLQTGRAKQKRAGYFVLDEADDMLEEKRYGDEKISRTESVLDQVKQIFDVHSGVHPDRQVWLFSATFEEPSDPRTWNENLRIICGKDPIIRIEVGGTKLLACKDVDQRFKCEGISKGWSAGESKLEVLTAACQQLPECGPLQKAVVFCQKDNVDIVVKALIEQGLKVEAYDPSVLERFRVEGSEPHILVCTDVLQRGVDLPLVKYVINFDAPRSMTSYVHRIGRTGRQGKKGFSLTLLAEADFRHARNLITMLEELEQTQPLPILREASRRGRERWLRMGRQDLSIPSVDPPPLQSRPPTPPPPPPSRPRARDAFPYPAPHCPSQPAEAATAAAAAAATTAATAIATATAAPTPAPSPAPAATQMAAVQYSDLPYSHPPVAVAPPFLQQQHQQHQEPLSTLRRPTSNRIALLQQCRAMAESS
mmetsp:Transcript_35554/g.75817  ORF Transcript_35554/g.75817 Transcript_35554/m.75817 type:complete len:662 (+) Transcript_35554:107-2092(+)